MKKVLAVVSIILLCGCSTLNYQNKETRPDGVVIEETVTFASVGGTDNATGQLSKDKKISIKGQQGIDAATLLQILTAIGAVAQ